MPNTVVCIYSCLCHQFKRCLRALWVRVLLFRLLCQINYLILFERRQKRLLEVTLQQKREKRWETGKKYWQNGNYQVNTINKEADSLGWRFRVFDLNFTVKPNEEKKVFACSNDVPVSFNSEMSFVFERIKVFDAIFYLPFKFMVIILMCDMSFRRLSNDIAGN